jgi:hypothetical protein
MLPVMNVGIRPDDLANVVDAKGVGAGSAAKGAQGIVKSGVGAAAVNETVLGGAVRNAVIVACNLP